MVTGCGEVRKKGRLLWSYVIKIPESAAQVYGTTFSVAYNLLKEVHISPNDDR